MAGHREQNWLAVKFLVAVLGRQQLSTENTLTPIGQRQGQEGAGAGARAGQFSPERHFGFEALPLLYNRNTRTFSLVARVLVLIAKVAGSWAISAILAGSDLFSPEVRGAFSAISRHAIGASFESTTLNDIFAGWLIALTEWPMPGLERHSRRDLASHLAGSVARFATLLPALST